MPPKNPSRASIEIKNMSDKLDALTHLLCIACEEIEDESAIDSLELQVWWRGQQATDKGKLERERSVAKVRRESRIAKLRASLGTMESSAESCRAELAELEGEA